MSIINSFIISTIAGMSTMIGTIIIFFNIDDKKINKFITFCLSFSLCIMISISLFDLIPTSFFTILFNYKITTSLLFICISFILGVFVIIFINKLINADNNSLYKLGIMSMITLMLHNLPEGIATFISSIADTSLGIKLSISIMLHNIPEGISIAVPIYYSTKSKSKALLYTFLSGFAEPLGALLAYIFLKNYITKITISIILLFVAGLMITLSIHELFPKAKSYKENKFIIIGIVLGIILILINHYIL